MPAAAPQDPFMRITKAAQVYEPPSGTIRFLVTNEEGSVTLFNAETFQITNKFNFPWKVNHASVSPDGSKIVVVGDNAVGRLVDAERGGTISFLKGHLDHHYASAWHPDGHMFATGNQDKSCRVWDDRMLAESLYAPKGNIGAINAISFTTDGRFMGTAESADFVHIYDVRREFQIEQQIDFFGKTSGISFSPDTEYLFIGVSPCANQNTSFLTYYRLRPHDYDDEFLTNVLPGIDSGDGDIDDDDDDEENAASADVGDGDDGGI